MPIPLKDNNLFKKMCDDVYASYPNPKDANLIIAGIILSSQLFLKNSGVLRKRKLLSGKKLKNTDIKIIQSYIMGAKAMFETFASGNLEPLLEQIINSMEEGDSSGKTQ